MQVRMYMADTMKEFERKSPSEPERSDTLWNQERGDPISRWKSRECACMDVPHAIFPSKSSAASYCTSRPLSI